MKEYAFRIVTIFCIVCASSCAFMQGFRAQVAQQANAPKENETAVTAKSEASTATQQAGASANETAAATIAPVTH